MIKIKLTPMGGYVVGDGPCPFDPDEFMKAFGHKLIEMKGRGLTEMGIPQEEIDAWMAMENTALVNAIDNANVIEIAQSRKATPAQLQERIFGAMDDARQLQIADVTHDIRALPGVQN